MTGLRNVRRLTAAALLAAVVPLAACGEKAATTEETANATDAGDQTLAAAIGEAPGLTTIAGALSEAGLASVFDGPGSYTVLAPDDDAFAKLGEGREALTAPARRAELVAILRGHVLPGHLTPAAIKKAIADKKGPVTMTTLADAEVTFSAAGDAITVTAADGSKATINGEPVVASNGVVLPLDGLIKQVPSAPAG
ncbi:fasciclin domain-containing protein [Tsuneonella sp. HG249]